MYVLAILVATSAVLKAVLVTGGAGYVGARVCSRLLARDTPVRVLDSLLHGQDAVAESLERAGAELIQGDLRDEVARTRALDGVGAVVHLAAIVGDPACARDPATAAAVNVEATQALIDNMRAQHVDRLVFASTCSNYGRMTDPNVLATEESMLAPVSLYAEQKVAIESELLSNRWTGLRATCLRFATVYGVAPRMRFDLTVNEFTRDLWAGRDLEIFGQQFWRPYVHVDDAAAAIELVLERDRDGTGNGVYNVGATRENYRKSDIVEVVQRHVGDGHVRYVDQVDDPRDYRVSFEKIALELGFRTRSSVDDGVRELVAALESNAFGDPFDVKHRNTP